MAKIEDGLSGSTLVRVDDTFKALRASIRPPEVLAWQSVGAVSGLMTGVAANGAVFSLRNISANLLLVRRVGITWATTTAFTTAQALGHALSVARAFTASDTGGTAILQTGSANKHRTALGIPTSLDMRIGSTGALTAGTRTLDAMWQGVAYGTSNAVGASMPPSSLLSHDTGDYPIVLAQNEGIVVSNLIAMGAAGVINLGVNLEYAEAAAF